MAWSQLPAAAPGLCLGGHQGWGPLLWAAQLFPEGAWDALPWSLGAAALRRA